MSVGLDYDDIGMQVGAMGKTILSGKHPKKIPHTGPRMERILVNPDTERRLGIRIRKDIAPPGWTFGYMRYNSNTLRMQKVP